MTYSGNKTDFAGMDKRNVLDKLQDEVRKIDELKKRARELFHVGVLVSPSDTSGYATVRKGKLFVRRSSHHMPSEVELSRTERAEFRIWCEEKAERLKQEAEERELKLAQGGIS